jgi:hypothetical protein
MIIYANGVGAERNLVLLEKPPVSARDVRSRYAYCRARTGSGESTDPELERLGAPSLERRCRSPSGLSAGGSDKPFRLLQIALDWAYSGPDIERSSAQLPAAAGYPAPSEEAIMIHAVGRQN